MRKVLAYIADQLPGVQRAGEAGALPAVDSAPAGYHPWDVVGQKPQTTADGPQALSGSSPKQQRHQWYQPHLLK